MHTVLTRGLQQAPHALGTETHTPVRYQLAPPVGKGTPEWWLVVCTRCCELRTSRVLFALDVTRRLSVVHNSTAVAAQFSEIVRRVRSCWAHVWVGVGWPAPS